MLTIAIIIGWPLLGYIAAVISTVIEEQQFLVQHLFFIDEKNQYNGILWISLVFGPLLYILMFYFLLEENEREDTIRMVGFDLYHHIYTIGMLILRRGVHINT